MEAAETTTDQTYTVTVRAADVITLANLAGKQWRTPEQQASALLEQSLQRQQGRSEGSTSRGKGRGHTNVRAVNVA